VGVADNLLNSVIGEAIIIKLLLKNVGT